jgi:2-polyprenyl-3-methyl-5-hydroxy-6-metoxy-1,4-benzoquinol methylase
MNIESTARSHWDSIYTSKAVTEISWFQKKPQVSLDLIKESGISKHDSIIDVGGGASSLVDFLLADGFSKITVLDISSVALDHAKRRLVEKTALVHWEVADVTLFNSHQNHFSLWHDRAVFHFLTKSEDQARYVEVLKKSLRAYGIVIMGTFGIGGAKLCSNLDIVQYNAEKMGKVVGPHFELLREIEETHITPSKNQQLFWYGVFRYRN